MKKFLATINGKKSKSPPIWLMRQAGRYLPEYRNTRKRAGGFLDLCYNSDLSTEVTLQPIRRFNFDAAILFADILLISQALGMKLWFEEGEGPRLNSIKNGFNINNLKSPLEIHETLNPIYQTVRNLSNELPKSTALIGFAGAPWTVATYMILGKGSKDHIEVKTFMNEHPEVFDQLIEILTAATIEYLSSQIEAGVEVVKLFDSWAGALSGLDMIKYSYDPLLRITKEIKSRFPAIPVIVFPRGVGGGYSMFSKTEEFSVLALDQFVPVSWAKLLQKDTVIQGNLDPIHLVHGGIKLKNEIIHLLESLNSCPFIFNLGHGITPDAQISNVELMLQYIREYD